MTGQTGRLGLALVLLLAACAAPSSSPPSSTTPSVLQPASESAAPSATPRATPATPAWREVTPAGDGPAAREDHTWTLTPVGGAAGYLFGGRAANGAALADLWAYDLANDSWTLLAADGPPPRFGHNAAWMDGIGLVIFAGQAGATFYNDLWVYEPAAGQWRELAAGGAVPVARYGSCAAIGPDGRLWISHGFTREGQRFADTRAYDFTTDTWTDETPAGAAPIQRCLHGCWWTDDGAFVLYAGQTNGVTSLGDLWRLSVGERPGTNTWSQLTPDGGLPPERNLYAAARWGAGTLVFGGQGLDGGYLSDTWWLADEGGARSIAIVGGEPPGRSGAELLADPERGRLLLFGGRNGDGAFDDTWELNIGTTLAIVEGRHTG